MRAILAISVLLMGFGTADAAWSPGANLSSSHQPSREANERKDSSASEIQTDENPFSAFWRWTTEDPVAFYTAILTLFTGVLGGSTLLLWKETKDSGETTRKLADATVQQVTIFKSQAEIQLWQHNIGRLQFLAQHRPRVIVRRIEGVFFHNKEDVPRPYVKVTIINIGPTVATVTNFGGTLLHRSVGTGAHFLPEGLSGEPQLIEPIELASGRRHTFDVTAPIGFTKDVFIRLLELRNNTDVFAIGVIRYKDEVGISRETGYWRRYDGAAERFVASTNPDEEYQD